MEAVKRIHHISAIVGHPQTTLEFYRDILGLKFVKKTVNFDDPNVYHLYFGDDDANPGTIITFFNCAICVFLSLLIRIYGIYFICAIL